MGNSDRTRPFSVAAHTKRESTKLLGGFSGLKVNEEERVIFLFSVYLMNIKERLNAN